MGWLGTLFGKENSIQGTLEGAGTFAKDIRSAITGDISSEKKAEIQLKIQEFENQILLSQTQINIAEAKGSAFQRNWRPSIGWVCSIGLFYHFLFRPIFYDLVFKYFKFTLQAIDSNALMALVVPLLGLGAYRSYEKTKDIQGKH